MKLNVSILFLLLANIIIGQKYSRTPKPTRPTTAPSEYPTLVPTNSPSVPPTLHPSFSPTTSPLTPTFAPTLTPSLAPTRYPSSAPIHFPSNAPSFPPTQAPTLSPSLTPTTLPTSAPTLTPTLAPSLAPTLYPSSAPIAAPSSAPSFPPSAFPTSAPTLAPSLAPISSATLSPILTPTLAPSLSPTAAPTFPFGPLPGATLPNGCNHANCSIYNVLLTDIIKDDVTIDDCTSETRRRSFKTENKYTKCIETTNDYEWSKGKSKSKSKGKGESKGKSKSKSKSKGKGKGKGSNRRYYHSSSDDSSPEMTNYIIITEVCLNYSLISLNDECGQLQSIFLPICANDISVEQLNKLITSYNPINVIQNVNAVQSEYYSSFIGININFMNNSNLNITSFEICFKNVIVDSTSEYLAYFNSLNNNNNTGKPVKIVIDNNITQLCNNSDGLPCLHFHKGKKHKKKGSSHRRSSSYGYNAINDGNDELVDNDDFTLLMNEMDPTLKWSIIAIIIAFIVLIAIAAFVCLTNNEKGQTEPDQLSTHIGTHITNNVNSETQKTNGTNFYDDLDLEMMSNAMEKDDDDDDDNDGNDNDDNNGEQYQVFGDYAE